MTQIHDTDRRNALLVAQMLHDGSSYSKRSDKWTIKIDGAGTLPLAEYLLKTLAESDASADRLALDAQTAIVAAEADKLLEMVSALVGMIGKDVSVAVLMHMSDIQTALRGLRNRGRS